MAELASKSNIGCVIQYYSDQWLQPVQNRIEQSYAPHIVHASKYMKNTVHGLNKKITFQTTWDKISKSWNVLKNRILCQQRALKDDKKKERKSNWGKKPTK